MIDELLVVGGGAAGYFAAIWAAELGCGKVRVLEKSGQVLRKVKISGGGRCNVTHACSEIRQLVECYPRGHREMLGSFYRWGVDDTVSWFEQRGVVMKTEEDGRMFPISNQSQTVIDCLATETKRLKVRVDKKKSVIKIDPDSGSAHQRIFLVTCSDGTIFQTANLLMATGGAQGAQSAGLITSLGHGLVAPTPSLFTFKIRHTLIDGLQGLSVNQCETRVLGTELAESGPVLITHWGVSGPGILKLSAWGAFVLSELGYRFTLQIDWLPAETTDGIRQSLQKLRRTSGRKQIATFSPFSQIPHRLWVRMIEQAGIQTSTQWAQLTNKDTELLVELLKATRLPVDGKSTNKDEFVTAGGIPLNEIKLDTMESKIQPNLFFAGEIINVDGITGGFNFQNAWTTGYLAGSAIAEKCLTPIG